MGELADLLRPVEAPGLRVALDDGIHVASLRHFAVDGPFGEAVRAALGMTLPKAGRLAFGAGGEASAAGQAGAAGEAGATGEAGAAGATGEAGAAGASATNYLLAWRRPSESLLLAADEAPLRQMQGAAAGVSDGCVIDLSGGACVVRVEGPASIELLVQLGGADVVPAPGEARGGRLAELPVTAIGIEAAEIWLVVERAYAPHLMDWVRVSAEDLRPAR